MQVLGEYCLQKARLQMGLEVEAGLTISISLHADLDVLKARLGAVGTLLHMTFDPSATVDLKTLTIRPELGMSAQALDVAVEAKYRSK